MSQHQAPRVNQRSVITTNGMAFAIFATITVGALMLNGCTQEEPPQGGAPEVTYTDTSPSSSSRQTVVIRDAGNFEEFVVKCERRLKSGVAGDSDLGETSLEALGDQSAVYKLHRLKGLLTESGKATWTWKLKFVTKGRGFYLDSIYGGPDSGDSSDWSRHEFEVQGGNRHIIAALQENGVW